jgi:putative multiple sugar transport system substrate-binding protein
MSVFKDTRTLASQAAKMASQVMNGQKVDVNDTDTYNNGKKDISSYLCSPVFVTVDNYKTILVDSGYYTQDALDY